MEEYNQNQEKTDGTSLYTGHESSNVNYNQSLIQTTNQIHEELQKTKRTIRTLTTFSILFFIIIICAAGYLYYMHSLDRGDELSKDVNQILSIISESSKENSTTDKSSTDDISKNVKQILEIISETPQDAKHLLTVSFENEIGTDEASDKTQVKNALAKGGTIRVDNSSDGFDYSFDSSVYGEYGAADADGMYWVRGAILNYIASKGWTLVQAQNVMVETYYFVK